MAAHQSSAGAPMRVLISSTFAFTICFAVWMIFAVLGIPIKNQLGLSETQFGLLAAMPVLTGSLVRVPLGIWTDRYGGRPVFFVLMLLAVGPIWLLSYATEYWHFLVLALFVGLTGGSFSVGTPYVARWFPRNKQGLAMGVFGAGNSGSAITKFVAPALIASAGGAWVIVPQVYAVALLASVFLHGSLASAQVCIGDCPPANLQVAVNELIVGVNILLGSASLAACPSYDANANSAVGVEELVSAVNNALDGCEGAPTPTPPTGGATSTVTRPPTRTPAAGPAIVFFTVTNADDSLQSPTGETADGIPIFDRPFGSGFKLVVEADGMFGGAPSTFEPGGVPALQIQTTSALGNQPSSARSCSSSRSIE